MSSNVTFDTKICWHDLFLKGITHQPQSHQGWPQCIYFQCTVHGGRKTKEGALRDTSEAHLASPIRDQNIGACGMFQYSQCCSVFEPFAWAGRSELNQRVLIKSPQAPYSEVSASLIAGMDLRKRSHVGPTMLASKRHGLPRLSARCHAPSFFFFSSSMALWHSWAQLAS